MLEQLILPPDVIEYVNGACSELNCSPSDLIIDALKLHNHASRIIYNEIKKSLELCDVENDNVS